MHAQDLQPALQAHLDAQIAAAENLLKTLEDERTALKGADAHALVDAGAAKVAALTRFEELEQARRLLCQGRDDRATFERLIETLDRPTSFQAAGSSIGPGATLQTTWQRLLELTGRCRDSNQTNGLIVTHRQKQIRQLLGMLRGGGSAQTYGPSGARSSIAAAARAIARA
jgi:flagellar biosynthesis/type III secretory pathway chaperone